MAAMTNVTDSVLIQASIEGDRTAFAALIGRYYAAVFKTVRRTLGNTTEGEDAVQEIFLRAMIALPKYDCRYPFAPWILRIACNYCIDQLRRRKTRKYKLWSDLSDAEERTALNYLASQQYVDDNDDINREKYLDAARLLLDRLKPKRRMAFVLRELEGREYEEVAAILGCSEVTARVRVWRARNDLHREFQKYLKKEGKDEQTLRAVQ